MSRPSQTQISSLPPSLQVLYQKQQEHAGLQALREASADLLGRVDKLAEMSHIMADGGEAIGGVLRNWPHVFSILNLFDKPAERPDSPNADDEPEPLPQLVRLPYGGESASTSAASQPSSTTAQNHTQAQAQAQQAKR